MWNYRIIRHVDCGHEYYALHEVYYAENGDIYAYSTNPIIVGDTVDEIGEDLFMMIDDINKPVIEYSELHYLQEDDE